MSDEKALIRVHPEGERQTEGIELAGISLDTFVGKVQFKWESCLTHDEPEGVLISNTE